MHDYEAMDINRKEGSMKRGLVITLAIFAALSATFGSLSCAPGDYTGPVESIVLAYAPFESTALVWIAEDQRFSLAE